MLNQDEVEAFLADLAEYQPVFPDSLVQYYLSRAGFVSDDVRVHRLVAVAAQKFVADIANDAIANSRLRAASAPVPHGARTKLARDPKIVLSLDDLELALREYCVDLKKPPYFADSLTAGIPDSLAGSQQQQQQQQQQAQSRGVDGIHHAPQDTKNPQEHQQQHSQGNLNASRQHAQTAAPGGDPKQKAISNKAQQSVPQQKAPQGQQSLASQRMQPVSVKPENSLATSLAENATLNSIGDQGAVARTTAKNSAANSVRPVGKDSRSTPHAS